MLPTSQSQAPKLPVNLAQRAEKLKKLATSADSVMNAAASEVPTWMWCARARSASGNTLESI